MVVGSSLLWFCTGRCVLLGEVAVKNGMTELEQALGPSRVYAPGRSASNEPKYQIRQDRGEQDVARM